MQRIGQITLTSHTLVCYPQLMQRRRQLKFSKTYQKSEKALREHLRELRARIRGKPSLTDTALSRIERGRFAKRLSRKRLSQARNGKRFVARKDELLRQFRPSPILDALFPGREAKWMPMIKRARRQMRTKIHLRDFSFLDYPNQTLEILKEIAIAECSCYRMEIDFDDEYIHDIGSYLAFYDLWPAIRQVVSGGGMRRPVQRVLKNMGIDADAQVRFHALRSEEGEANPDIWAMPVQRRRPIKRRRASAELLRPQTSDKAANRFGELVNDWLNADGFGMELTDDGMSNLKGIFGELLCNAERHSRPDGVEGDWTMAAFMARRAGKDDATTYVCRVAVLNLGQSIAESFTNAHPDVLSFMDNYATAHANQRQSSDTLRTVFALQDMVTSDRNAFIARDGGTGLQSAIEFFHSLGDQREAVIDPRMTIVSGKSCLMLRDEYVVGKRPPSPDGRLMPRQLWFNKSNTREMRPDQNYVFDLDHHFGGTLITMAFTLDLHFLKDSLEPDHGESDLD